MRVFIASGAIRFQNRTFDLFRIISERCPFCDKDSYRNEQVCSFSSRFYLVEELLLPLLCVSITLTLLYTT